MKNKHRIDNDNENEKMLANINDIKWKEKYIKTNN